MIVCVEHCYVFFPRIFSLVISLIFMDKLFVNYSSFKVPIPILVSPQSQALTINNKYKKKMTMKLT